MSKVKSIQGGHRNEAVRWSMYRAAQEFGTNERTLKKRQLALGIQPGEDGFFSSKDVAAMLFGDKEAETIRKISAEARGQELKNAVTEGELIPLASVLEICRRIIVPIRQRILSSSMSETERHDALADLVSLGEVDWSKEAGDAE